MDRRYFLQAVSLVSMFPMFGTFCAQAAGQIKITGVKLQNLKVEKDMSSFVDYVGRTRSYRVGGGNFCIVETDAGIAGFGSAVSASQLQQINRILVGKDPFEMELNAERLKDVPGSGASVEIALWYLF